MHRRFFPRLKQVKGKSCFILEEAFVIWRRNEKKNYELVSSQNKILELNQTLKIGLIKILEDVFALFEIVHTD